MLVLFVFVGLSVVACGPSVTMKSAGGYDFYFASRTGLAGHDLSGVVMVPKKKVKTDLKVVTLGHSYTKNVTTWTNCSSEKPNRHAKNVHQEEVHKQWTEQRIISVPAVNSLKTYAYFGGNPSLGNSSLGSLFMAGGIVGGAALLRPSNTVNNNSAAGGQGGKGGFGQGGNGGSANVSQDQSQSNWQDQNQSSGINLKNEN